MLKTLTNALAALVAIFAVIATTGAPAGAEAGRRVALVIGQNAYINATPLENPRNDAEDVARRLAVLGFEVVEGYDLNRQQMSETIREFAQLLDGAEVGLFFYAGHGLQVDGKNYMTPIDMALQDKSSLDFEAVDMNVVLAQMEREPRVNLIFLDACRDNPLSRSLARSMGASRSAAVGSGLAQMESVAVGTLIAYSTQPGAVAADGQGRNSPFTAALLEEMGRPGLEVQQIMRRVRAKVVDGSGGAQVPWDHSSLTNDFFFQPPPAGTNPDDVAVTDYQAAEPSAKALELRLWNDVKDSGDAAQLQSYLDQYPQGLFAGAAQARINGLGLQGGGSDAAAIAALFDRLAKRDVVIEDPQEPHEFYSNARLYELKGDFLNAAAMYEKFFTFGLDFVDPHLRYQKFLRAQEGRTGARQIYNEMAYDRPDDRTLAFAASLLAEPEQRKEKLEAVLATDPSFTPASYELSLDYSQRRLGSQTLADQRKELEYLKAFLAAVEDGSFYGFFLDKQAAAEWIEDAETRLKALEAIGVNVLEQPVQMSASASGSGWTLVFSGVEQVTEYFVSLDGGPPESLGFFPHIDAFTGKPAAKSFMTIPINAKAQPVSLSYTDRNGEMQGPFAFDFDPDAARIAGEVNMIRQLSTSWIAFRDYDGRRLVYFTSLVSSRCGIKEVRYGVGKDTPDTVFPMGPCNKNAPGSVVNSDGSDNEIYITVPNDTAFMTVQIDFADGTTSDIERFEVLE